MTGSILVIRVRVTDYELEAGEGVRVVVLPTDQAHGQQMTIPMDDILSFQDHETLAMGS